MICSICVTKKADRRSHLPITDDKNTGFLPVFWRLLSSWQRTVHWRMLLDWSGGTQIKNHARADGQTTIFDLFVDHGEVLQLCESVNAYFFKEPR